MVNKFEYLKKYMWQTYKEEKVQIWRNNIFYEISSEEIESAELKIEMEFPTELKEFYQDIRCVYLTTPNNAGAYYKSYHSNEILPPLAAAHFYQGILEHQIEPKEEALSYDEEHWLALATLEILKPGDLPFFEIADSSNFLIMKLRSENPNAVWTDCGTIKIEDSFEKFIWRLYYEDPGYYGQVIEAHYSAKH